MGKVHLSGFSLSTTFGSFTSWKIEVTWVSVLVF